MAEGSLITASRLVAVHGEGARACLGNRCSNGRKSGRKHCLIKAGLLHRETIVGSAHACEGFIGIRRPGGGRFKPVAEELETLLGSCLDQGIAVAEMPIGGAGADPGAARCFVQREALRSVFGNEPSCRGSVAGGKLSNCGN